VPLSPQTALPEDGGITLLQNVGNCSPVKDLNFIYNLSLDTDSARQLYEYTNNLHLWVYLLPQVIQVISLFHRAF